jgi:adenylosuccinate lyase
MIERYCTEEMKSLWSDESRLARWLKVELAVCRGWAALGIIPAEAPARMEKHAHFSVSRVEELERETRHDVVAFIQNVTESLGDDGPHLHLGVTSSDIIDTALALALCRSLDLLKTRLDALLTSLEVLAKAHKYSLAPGRTHGVHGEPTTFGLKCLLWYADMKRHRESLPAVREEVAVGKISGAVGTYATVDPAVEAHACRDLELSPDPVSTQILQRERHGRYMNFLAILGCTVEKIAVELRHLQRTEVLEAVEGFGPGQKGSSAMPHKKNPVSAENLCGLSRVLRGNALAAMENISLWHERDISHSSAERIILPDSSILADYMLVRLRRLLDGLVVNEKRMRKNLDMTRGLVFSQRVLLALIEKGLDRGSAYRIVQESAKKVWDDEGLDFRTALKEAGGIEAHLSGAELEQLFDYGYYTRFVDTIFARFRF